MRTMTIITAVAALASASAGCVQAEEAADDETIEEVDGKADGRYKLPELGVQFDRIGRPEMTNITLAAPDLKPLYNAEDPFALSDKRATYQAALTGMLRRYDTFDQRADMNDAQLAHLVGILLDDHLRVDLGKPCNDIDGSNYLAIERAEYAKQAWTSCGGRTPNEDVIDDVLTLVTGGLAPATAHGDGIGTWDTRSATAKRAFPYLADPFQ